jgi:tetratricopeptide (TPR) repeat protein
MSEAPRTPPHFDIEPFLDGSIEDSDPWLAAWQELVLETAETEEADEEDISALVARLLPLHAEPMWKVGEAMVSRVELIEGLLRALLAEAEFDKVTVIGRDVLDGQPYEGEMKLHRVVLLLLLSAAESDGQAREGRAREALELLNEIAPGATPLRLDALRLISEGLNFQGDDEGAVAAMEEALAMETTKPLELSTKLALARTYFLAGKKPKANALVAELLPVDKHGLDKEQEVAFLSDLVAHYTFIGQDPAAAKLLEARATELAGYDPIDKRLPPILEMLAMLDARKHNRPAMQKHLSQALEVLGNICGKGSVQYRASAMRISAILEEMELPDEAKAMLSALIEEDRRHSYTDELAQEALRSFITLCLELGEPKEAIAARQRLLEVLSTQGIVDMDEVLREELLLAVEHARAGEEDAAVRLIRRVEPRVRALDDEGEQAIHLLALAEAHQHLKDWISMEREASQAVAILKTKKKEVDLLADAYTALAYARRGQGRISEGRKSIDEALRLLERVYGKDSEEFDEQRECLEDFPTTPTYSRDRAPVGREKR